MKKPRKRPILTDPQERALMYLNNTDGCTPAMLGDAVSGELRQDCKGLSGRPVARTRQGSGRIGGAMFSRLKKRGLVTWVLRFGWQYYTITAAGRAELAIHLKHKQQGYATMCNECNVVGPHRYMENSHADGTWTLKCNCDHCGDHLFTIPIQPYEKGKFA